MRKLQPNIISHNSAEFMTNSMQANHIPMLLVSKPNTTAVLHLNIPIPTSGNQSLQMQTTKQEALTFLNLWQTRDDGNDNAEYQVDADEKLVDFAVVLFGVKDVQNHDNSNKKQVE